MVNLNNNNDYYRSGGGGYSRLPWEPTERPTGDIVINDNDRPISVPARSTLPSTVGDALRDQCHINWRSFFLAVTLDNGEHVYLTGPGTLSRRDGRQLFDMERFLQFQGQQSKNIVRSDSYPDSDMYYHENGTEHQPYRQQSFATAAYPSRADTRMTRARRRQRTSTGRRAVEDNEPVPVPTVRRGIKIGDSQAVWVYYQAGFTGLQQLACKLIAKTFIKAIAPRKQTKHPYTHGEASAPSWWPRPWGPTTADRVRHREPDHLLKPERVHLLAHILRLVTDPIEAQHEGIREVGMTVSKLESITMDAMSLFFSDPNITRNAAKRNLLKEVFKIAKQEEKCKKGYIDENTVVYVSPDQGTHDSEEEEEEEEDDESSSAQTPVQEVSHYSPGAASRVSPVRTPPSFMGELTSRPAAHYADTMDLDAAHHPAHQSHHPYTLPAVGPLPTITTMQLDDIMSSPSDAGRRSSLYASAQAAEYPSAAATGPQVYPTATTTWQGAAATVASASTNPTMYAFASTPHPPPTNPFASHHHHHHQQPYMSSYGAPGYPSTPPNATSVYSPAPGNGGRYNTSGSSGMKPEGPEGPSGRG
ncbi:hypothetical protein QBC43DRAFT_287942 [Cladorrhinum sp. PSN259]|nr:hypothetical protein QBC43DRAFT_287942 [Cladorrhinum sp. PSN259]